MGRFCFLCVAISLLHLDGIYAQTFDHAHKKGMKYSWAWWNGSFMCDQKAVLKNAHGFLIDPASALNQTVTYAETDEGVNAHL